VASRYYRQQAVPARLKGPTGFEGNVIHGFSVIGD
jgi:hypothetical protein